MTRILTWFYAAMRWLSEFEYAVAEATSTNFTYVARCREDARNWAKEQRLFELRRG